MTLKRINSVITVPYTDALNCIFYHKTINDFGPTAYADSLCAAGSPAAFCVVMRAKRTGNGVARHLRRISVKSGPYEQGFEPIWS